METVAGSRSTSSYGNGGPATSAGISDSYGMDRQFGKVPDAGIYQLRKVDTAGIIHAYIGSGSSSSAGNSGPALSVALDGAAYVTAILRVISMLVMSNTLFGTTITPLVRYRELLALHQPVTVIQEMEDQPLLHC